MKKEITAKKWLIMFGVTVVLVLALCSVFNIAVDPFGVFSDMIFDWYSYNKTNNPRVAKIEYLKGHSDKYNAYIIGSSSAASYNPAELKEYTGDDYYNLFVYGCDTKDYRGFADFVANNCDVKSIILNLGMNEATDYDYGNNSLNECEHYLASGENPLKFYLKYAFCNPKYSLEKITSYFKDTYLPKPFDVFDVESGCYDKRVRDAEKIGDMDNYISLYKDVFAQGENTTNLPYIEACVESVRYIKSLCEERGIELTVCFSPVYISQWKSAEPEAIREYKERMAKVTDYYDFSLTSVSYDSRYFYDDTHFRNAVGSMMLAYIYGNKDIYVPEDFGAYVTKENVEEYTDSMLKESKKPDIADYTTNLPVLMYHHIDKEGDGGATISEAVFLSHMDALKAAGYNTVDTAQIIDYVYKGIELPENPVLITFDDGYKSNLDIASPILRERDMKATVFVIGCLDGLDAYKDTGEKIISHFDSAEAGDVIDVQSHTYDMHQSERYETGKIRSSMVKLPEETDEEFAEEIRRDVERFRENVTYAATLAYPYGIYDTLTEVILREEGILATFSTDINVKNILVKGLPQSLSALCRYSMRDDVSIEEMLALLR
ncbi:MAG: polysaccharide deacetylase family protein [Clostridiales bacterium]|nr:polysaccharide deacetylase family protein [Clostridiales bacterium]